MTNSALAAAGKDKSATMAKAIKAAKTAKGVKSAKGAKGTKGAKGGNGAKKGEHAMSTALIASMDAAVAIGEAAAAAAEGVVDGARPRRAAAARAQHLITKAAVGDDESTVGQCRLTLGCPQVDPRVIPG